MTQIYSWTSDQPSEQHPTEYWQSIQWVRPDPELDIQIDPNDPQREEKLKELEIKRQQKWAEQDRLRAIEDAIDEARFDRLAETMRNRDEIKDILSELTRVQLQIFIYCIDRPNQMFTPRDLYRECTAARHWVEEQQRKSVDGFNKSKAVREQCEILSQNYGIGVSIADPEDFHNGKFEYGFGFLWDEDDEVPEIPHQFETLLGRKSNIQLAAEYDGMRKRDREILEAAKQETRAAMARLQELHQRYVERNNKFLSENIRNWRVPGV